MNKIFAPFLPPWVETGLQPAFYDMESGTVLQQTARMYAKVQQLTRLFNELSEETKTTVEEYIAKFDVLEGKFVELKEFVEDYFDNLDVQEEINNKLDAMVEDGTLDIIVSKYLMIQPVNYINDICTLAYRPTAETRGLQGGCYCGDGNIACYFTSTNTIQVISLSTGNVLREFTDSRFGHGNGMCKSGNYLYLLGTGSAETNKIYKVKYDTLDSVEVIDPYGEDLIPAGSNISSICYNPSNEHFYITLGLPFPTLYCYEMNDDFTELINTYEVDNTNEYGGFITNICYWKGYIVVNYNYGKTQLFKASDFSLYKTTTIDKNVGNRYYSEIEWLDAYTDEELLIGAICESGEGYGNGIYSFGTCNMYSSYRDFPGNYKRGTGTTGEAIKGQNNIWVDTNAEFKVKRLGTQSDPFISIYEATNSCQLDDFCETIIHIAEGSDISTSGIYLCNTRVVKILYTQDNLSCREMHFQSNQQVYVRGILPLDELYVKESSVMLYSVPTNTADLTLNVYNTGDLTIQTNASKLNLKGTCAGKLDFVNANAENGIVGVLNENGDGYTDMVFARNINNVSQRGRLGGSSYTPTTSMTFFTNLAYPKQIYIQVGTNYVALPVTIAKTYNVTLPDASVMSVAITQDTTTYNFATLKFVISHPTLTIYDSLIVY